MKPWLLLAACLTMADVRAGDQPLAGRLCVAGAPCRDSSCNERIPPSDETRSFTIAAASEPAYVLGILKAGESSVPCTGGVLELRLSARKLPRRADVRVTVGNDESGRWELTVPERQLSNVITVRLPHGTHDVSVEGLRSARVHKSVAITNVTARVSVDLEPLPRLSGTVLTRTGRLPVAGAVITTDVVSNDIDKFAVTDVMGRFSMDADPEHWPTKVIVRSVPYAETTAPIPAARVSATLPDIYLSRGGSVSVELEQHQAGDVLELELQPIVRNTATGKPVATMPVPPMLLKASMRFANVEPGRYVVLAKGNEDLERHGTVAEVVQDANVQVDVAVVPFSLRVQTKMDGETLPKAEILLTHLQGYWEGAIETDREGKAAVKLWQAGRVRSAVHAAAFTAPHIERRSLPEGEDHEWVLDIQTREIVGTVVDSKTGEPVPNAALSLHVEGLDGFSLSANTTADAQGRFRFSPVHHGQHRLKTAAAHYPPHEMSYSFLEPETRRNVTVRVDRSAIVRLTVLNAMGSPIAGARVIRLNASIPMQGHTDSSGKLDVPVPEDQEVDVYVIPSDGSFGIATLKPNAKETTIRIAEAVGRILIRTETEKHVPIPNVSVLIRYNGRVLPVELLDALARLHGGGVRSDDQGRLIFPRMPAGLYELWPVGSVAELRALAAGLGPEAGIRMTVAPGENVAVMTFEPAIQQ